MNYRNLGRTGVKISPLVLGTDNFANPTPVDECNAILDAAIGAGINLIDTSNSYAKGEAERVIGDWLVGNGKRSQVLLATKVFYLVASEGEQQGLDLVRPMLRPLIEKAPKMIPMLCGTKGFVRPLRAYLVEAGYDRKEVKIETYD